MSVSSLIPIIDLSFNMKENTTFTQYAYDIIGAESGGLAGQSISKNLSGDIIAVGAPLNSGGGTARGEVRVYQKDNNSWLQLGADLNGTKNNEEFGHSVDLNGDGTILGVGSKDTSNNLIVYKYDGSAWNQYGNNIHVVNNNISYNSHSLTPEIKVKLNKEGNKLVTMNKYNVSYGNTNNYEEELVQAYEYSSPSWNQIGNSIESSSLHDLSGGDIAINDEGNMIAIGYPHTNSATGTTKVFKYDTSWNQVGSNIDGSATGDNAGTVVAIDGSGDLVAIGSPFANITLSNTVTTTTVNGVQQGTEFLCDNRARYGQGLNSGISRQSHCAINGDGTRIFTGGEHALDQEFDGTLKIADWDGAQWNITEINRVARYSNTGYSVSSSNSGNTIAVGAPNGGSTDPYEQSHLGAVYIFNWDGSQWNFTAELGPGTSYWFGHHVNLNRSQYTNIDGTVLLVGEYWYGQNGAVHIYEYDGTNWNKKGQTITGGSGDNIQSATCINGDGNIFACGSYARNRVDVYEWNASSSTWVTKGNRINRPSGASGSHFGSALSMTGDGLTIVIGSIDGRYNNYTGEVYVYEWNGSDWQQKGQTITNTGMGHSVTVNNDGTVLAVGGLTIDSDNYSEAGKVLTYQWNGSDWEKFGAEYYGEEKEEHLGFAVALNYSGSHLLAIGKQARVFQTGLTNTFTTITNYTGGKVNVYKNSNDSWNPYGNVLEGQADNDQFGTSIDMTPAGNILAVGAVNANAGKGNVNIYQYNETDSSWNKVGGDLSGDAVGDLTGTSVKLNQLGTEVSVGEPQPANLGKVRTFELSHTLNYEANTFQSSYLDGFLDISGGELRTRNADDHLLIGGDASMSGNVFIKGETIENKNIIISYTLIDISFSQLENTNFTQYAYDISGAEFGGLAGHSISTSASGDIIAVGAPLNSGGGTARGEVRVYQKDNNSWLQLGSVLNGAADNNEFGHSVDLNGDGTILGVGSKDTSNNLIIYQYDGSVWNQYGNNIHVVNNNISYNNHSLTPAIKVKLNKEGNKLVTMNKYNVTNIDITTTTGPYTPLYITAGCTNNWDFRVNENRRITDNIGSNVATYYSISSTVADGASFSVDYNEFVWCDGVTYGDPFSFEVYFKFTATGNNYARVIDIDSKFAIARYGTTSGWFIASANSGWENIGFVDHTIVNDTWYHVVYTSELASGTGVNQKAYIDGVLVGQDSTINNVKLSALTSPVYFGRREAGASTGAFAGKIRYGRMYNGKTLSQSEVTDLYNAKDDTTPAGTTITTITDNSVDYENEVVQAYEYSEPSWNQIGNTIESSSLHDLSGGDIAINDEGNMIAVGYPQTNSATGTTKVYKYDTSWNQVGSNIDGSATGDHAGTAVVMDENGDLVAIGSPNVNAGEVNVYQNVDDTWTLYGNKIQGQADNDQFGTSLDIDPSGTIIAVGAVNANAGKGNVNIYKYNETYRSWNKVGGDLSGDAVGDLTGTSVKLNQLGTEVSVGEPNSNVSNASLAHVNAVLYWNFAEDITATTIGGDIGPAAIFRGDDGVGNDEVITATLTESEGLQTSRDRSDDLRAVTKSFVFPSDTFTIELYLKLNQDRGSNTFLEYAPNGTNGAAGNYGRIWFYRTNASQIRIRMFNSTGSYSEKYYSCNFQDNTWHHLVFVCDMAHANGARIDMYENGSFVTNQTHTVQTDREPGFDRELGVSNAYRIAGYECDFSHKQLQVIDGLLDATEVAALYTKITGGVATGKGGARTFEIEHTKIYEPEYKRQSNSAIIGHNEYSRNQFSTALDVSGNVDVSGNITVTGNITIPGDITVDGLNFNSINKAPPISIDYSDITEDLSFNHKIEIMTNDNSLQTSSLTIHNDLSNNGTFGSSFVYDNSLSVTGSVVVVDASNINYGSYTVYSKKDGSDSFMVGKSANNSFNIVNQSNVGVWMERDGNSFHSTSDENLKKDIEDLGEETDSIMKLRPVKFNWNYEEEDKEKHIGFIAQEVEELFPNLVEENTYPDGSTYKGVDKTKLIPHLVNEIKSIKKEIEELKK